MRANIRLVLVLALIGLIVIFTIQNVAEVEIQFLLWGFQTRRALLIFVVLAIGIMIGWIAHSVRDRTKRNPHPAVPTTRPTDPEFSDNRPT